MTTWMRALTLTQPWCGLVAADLKPIENRPRPMIRREDFGKPFALHASREIDESVYNRIDRIWPRCGMYMGDNDATCPVLTCRRRDGHGGAYDNVNGESDDKEWMRLSRVTSAVIAVATIERAVVLTADNQVLDLHSIADVPVDLGDQRRWLFGPIGYVLRDVRALTTPVPCRGAQGFWHLTPKDERERGELSAVERAVVEQIARAA